MNASKILPGLYQGGAPPSADSVRRAGFKLLVLCAIEIQPNELALDGLPVLRCPLSDVEQLSTADWDQALKTGRRVAFAVANHDATLVTCAQGLNRSGLVTAVAVHTLTGWPGKRVVEHIRKRRDHALFNQTFVRAIESL